MHRRHIRHFQMNLQYLEDSNDFLVWNLSSTCPTEAPKFIKLILEQEQKFDIINKLKEIDKRIDNDTELSKTQAHAHELE